MADPYRGLILDFGGVLTTRMRRESRRRLAKGAAETALVKYVVQLRNANGLEQCGADKQPVGHDHHWLLGSSIWSCSTRGLQDAQRGMQYHLDASHRSHGTGHRPKSAIGSLVSAVLNLIGLVIALGILGLVAFVGYFIMTSN